MVSTEADFGVVRVDDVLMRSAWTSAAGPRSSGAKQAAVTQLDMVDFMLDVQSHGPIRPIVATSLGPGYRQN